MHSNSTPVYEYRPLLEGADSVRLLRLLRSSKGDPIRCELIDYTLPAAQNSAPYDALSYVWGSTATKKQITIVESSGKEYSLDVTINLFSALQHLCDPLFERILWIDAICINQNDLDERERQVQLMTRIYWCANRVIVWLGDEDEHTEEIFKAIETSIYSTERRIRQMHASAGRLEVKIAASILRRPWFKRTWEVAAAKSIHLKCGVYDLSGSAFLRLIQNTVYFDHFMRSHGHQESLRKEFDPSQCLIYLMNSEPPAILNRSTQLATLAMLSLGELIEMFYSHETTDQRDKVYSLLGMSYDGQDSPGLNIDYRRPWRDLFHNLAKHILGSSISVTVSKSRTAALIQTRGIIIGRIVMATDNINRAGTQQIFATRKQLREPLWDNNDTELSWTINKTTKRLQSGDIICLFEGASEPSIVRFCGDYFTIVAIAVNMSNSVEHEESHVKIKKPSWRMEYGDGRWFSVPKSAELISQRSFLLVWDWESETRYSELEPYVVMEPQLDSSSPESLSTENSKTHITNPILPHLVPNPRLQDRVSRQKISDYLNEKDIDLSALSGEGEAGCSSLELCRLSEAARIMDEAEDCPSLAKIIERFTEIASEETANTVHHRHLTKVKKALTFWSDYIAFKDRVWYTACWWSQTPDLTRLWSHYTLKFSNYDDSEKVLREEEPSVKKGFSAEWNPWRTDPECVERTLYFPDVFDLVEDFDSEAAIDLAKFYQSCINTEKPDLRLLQPLFEIVEPGDNVRKSYLTDIASSGVDLSNDQLRAVPHEYLYLFKKAED
ncbi:HET-domain-containing protein [Corynespora cassiicola Philippines]|uniref:HET-domain-containing protein n=1 Tax=Corynespora cassiicola Philippines TaxID=1448308 RepID=A0A2T2PBR9_CORCC|nr:HET-domain-containing protein [Corynespora cassiicola Philippines]